MSPGLFVNILFPKSLKSQKKPHKVKGAQICSHSLLGLSLLKICDRKIIFLLPQQGRCPNTFSSISTDPFTKTIPSSWEIFAHLKQFGSLFQCLWVFDHVLLCLFCFFWFLI